jgi:CDP-glucose 4,6-dehydratase
MESLVRLPQLRSIYNGKRVFLTGHTGFKGTWLNAILYKLGAIVKGYALEPEGIKEFFMNFSGHTIFVKVSSLISGIESGFSRK